MEAFKISVEVNVNLSLTEGTQQFIQSCLINRALVDCLKGPVNLSGLCGCGPTLTGNEASKAEEALKAEDAPKAKIDEDAPKAKIDEDAPKAKIDIEELRAVLKDKVNTHREAIKAKLNELGAPSVTKLAADKYEEMYNFLTSLPNE